MKALLRVVALAAAAAPLAAHADLFRWVDPQSGSVKFSSVPPPWYGDAAREAASPRVQVIVARPAGVPLPAAETAAAPAAPAPVAALESTWRGVLREFSLLPERPDFVRSAESIQQQLRGYETLRAELDRLDPAGAARRRADEGPVLERLKRGLQAQFK